MTNGEKAGSWGYRFCNSRSKKKTGVIKTRKPRKIYDIRNRTTKVKAFAFSKRQKTQQILQFYNKTPKVAKIKITKEKQ